MSYKSIIMRLTRIAVAPVLIVLSASLLYAQKKAPVSTGTYAPVEPPLSVGTYAPEANTTMLDGQQFFISRFRGHVLLIDIWAAWCPDCRSTMSSVEKIAERASKSGVYVVGIACDTEKTLKDVPLVIKNYGVQFPVSARPTENIKIAQNYNAHNIPAMYLIDKQGRIRWSSFTFKTSDVSKVNAMISQLAAE